MPDVERIRIISDADVIRNIRGERGRYALYLGAGASVEAGVMPAEEICQAIRTELLAAAGLDGSSAQEIEGWANDNLNWGDASRRYMTCVRRWLPNEARRVEYFRHLVIGVRPSFCHHAVALLMSNGYVRPTCVTTNFDHLLESAFMQQGLAECQPIRNEFECRYWEDRSDRYYLIKLHGDIDTLNILNTREETIAISDEMATIVGSLTSGAGLVVLGTAGNEKSVRALFDDLGRRSSSVLSFGLLWGVYMGTSKPRTLTPDDLRQSVLRRIEATEMNRDIVEVIGDSRNDLFCCFPVWGAGEFLRDLVTGTQDKPLIGGAAQYFDHDMRLRHVFAKAGLSDEAVTRHLNALHKEHSKLRSIDKAPRPDPEVIFSAAANTGTCEVRVLYGDITSRSLMGADEFGHVRRAVVSPDDTLVSAGGGVAYRLLEKAGREMLLNELEKFAPIPQRTIAVTSAGALPVHHVFHAATIEVDRAGTYAVSKDDVSLTVLAILDAASALDVGVVWIPLLAAGVASLQPADSFTALLDGVCRWHHAAAARREARGLTIVVVIYQERLLPRNEVAQALRQILGSDFEVQSTGATNSSATADATPHVLLPESDL